MKGAIRQHPYLTARILITPLALIAGFISAGFGHGDYIAARVLLPFACAVMPSTALIILAAILQWPFYGGLLDAASNKARIAMALFIVHSALCFWLFIKDSEPFR